MNLNELRISTKLRWFLSTSSVFLLLLSACAPKPLPATSGEVLTTATEVPITPNIEVTQPPILPSATPQAEVIYPYYLPLATKPEVAPQTLNGVTVAIDWAYVDESRVALQYTISGLDWPDKTAMDASQQVQISSPALANARFGGFSGAGGGLNSLVENGVITASTDQLLVADALDAQKTPTIHLNVDIPVEGPTKIGTFHFEFNVPAAVGFKIEDIDQTVLANNVSMTLKSLRLTPSHAEALICFQMPSAVDWGLTASKIVVGGREYPFSGGGLATAKGDPNSALTAPERCNDVGFDIAYDKSDTSITLIVPRLMGSVPEVVDQARLELANQRLADKGIQFNYVTVDHGGNFEILQRPEGLSDAEIYPLIWDALAEQYEGPWEFTVPIQR